MGMIAFIDDVPDADKECLLSHRQETLNLAAELGITNMGGATQADWSAP